MSLCAHPSDETLLGYAAGMLPFGLRVVVEAHLSLCSCCRAQVRAFEAVGGALLDEEAPGGLALAELQPGALDLALAGIAQVSQVNQADQAGAAARFRGHGGQGALTVPGLPDGFVLPAALGACSLAPLRPLAPGMRMGRVRVPGDPKADVRLLRIGPGRRIPHHTHSGREFTQVLAGAYRDELGRYGPGDFVEADGTLTHTPVVEGEEDCICLVAMEGPLRFSGLMGVLLRPFA